MEARFRWAAGATTWPQIKAKAVVFFFSGWKFKWPKLFPAESLQLPDSASAAGPAPRAVHEHDISFPHCFLPLVSQLPPSILSYHELCHPRPWAHRNHGVLGGHQNETASHTEGLENQIQ